MLNLMIRTAICLNYCNSLPDLQPQLFQILHIVFCAQSKKQVEKHHSSSWNPLMSHQYSGESKDSSAWYSKSTMISLQPIFPSQVSETPCLLLYAVLQQSSWNPMFFVLLLVPQIPLAFSFWKFPWHSSQPTLRNLKAILLCWQLSLSVPIYIIFIFTISIIIMYAPIPQLKKQTKTNEQTTKQWGFYP